MFALLISQPLHFGDYGGLPLKIIWAAVDIVTIIVLVSGLYLWAGRWRSTSATERTTTQTTKPNGGRLTKIQSAGAIFRAPAIIALISAAGLATALIGDGLWNAMSWLALSVPIAVAIWYAHHQR